MSFSLSALSVTTPAAWWALLTLEIPLLIHLFSRSRGRLVRIGHVDLVRKARKLQVTEIKMTQWLLLLLRLAIFTLAVLILGGLATAGLNSTSAPSSYLTPGWIRTSSQQDFNAVLSAAEKEADSKFYLLQAGFPPADKQQLEAIRQQPLPGPANFSNTWSLLSERLSLERHEGEVRVYATDYILQFGSYRPTLPREVNWHITHPQQAPADHFDSIQVLIAYSRDRAADAATFNTVLETLKQHRLPNLVWESADSDRPGQLPVKTNWLIHLGDEKLSPAQIAGIKSPVVILTDSDGGKVEGTNQFVRLPYFPFTSFRLDRFSRNIAEIATGETVAEGRVLLETKDHSPLLQEFHHGQVRLLRFNSRFNPQWNSVTQQPEFPEFLLQLMSDTGLETSRFSNARINPVNLDSESAKPITPTPLPRRSLQDLLAALLVLFWMTERWLSERKAREKR